MGTVPDAYFQFVMHYAPYYYVVPTNLAADAAAGQKNVTVADGSKFQADFPVEIKDSAHSEWSEVESVLGNVVTLKNNLANSYFIAKAGLMEGPDPAFGRGTFAAAFAIEFLCEAYSAPQFSSQQSRHTRQNCGVSRLAADTAMHRPCEDCVWRLQKRGVID